MTKEQQVLHAQAERLQRQLATAEATVGTIKAKLARIEAKLTGQPLPETGLDLLWEAAKPIARTRSSKQQCRIEWQRIPAHERPPVRILLDALNKWNRCDEWRKEGGAFIKGLHLWIKYRQWENIPEQTRPDPAARSRVPEKLTPITPPEEQLTPQEVAALFSGMFSDPNLNKTDHEQDRSQTRQKRN